MKYTKYLAGKVNESGVPNFTQKGFKNYMNVIYLEGKLAGFHDAKKLTRPAELHKFDMEVFNVGKKITEITGNLEPGEFVKMQVEDV
ncbi:MAG: hypothetical protein ACI8ZM_005236 [Crocinitomix sp.]|jgi:hypothetical protein